MFVCLSSLVLAGEIEVERGLFQQKIQLQGLAVLAVEDGLSIAPLVWEDLIVEKVLNHGARIKNDEQIIWFETEKN